jgi:hypothetical protein
MNKPKYTSKDFKGSRPRRRSMARKMNEALTFKAFLCQVFNESEQYYVIAHNWDHAEEILLASPDEITKEAISDMEIMNPEQMKLVNIEASEELEQPETNLYEVFKNYDGSGEIICSTNWKE